LEELYRAVYGDAWREHTRLGWCFDSPLAEAGSAVAVAGDLVIATQPYCDFPLHTPWGVTRATLFLNVATHPAHRRQGLFRRVVAAARTAAFERGAAVVLTTPNRTAFHGFQTMPDGSGCAPLTAWCCHWAQGGVPTVEGCYPAEFKGLLPWHRCSGKSRELE
jgi:GNAT superfamily N-acetyltransferase